MQRLKSQPGQHEMGLVSTRTLGPAHGTCNLELECLPELSIPWRSYWQILLWHFLGLEIVFLEQSTI